MLLAVGGPGTGGEQALPERILLVSEGSSDIPFVRWSFTSNKIKDFISTLTILHSFCEFDVLNGNSRNELHNLPFSNAFALETDDGFAKQDHLLIIFHLFYICQKTFIY